MTCATAGKHANLGRTSFCCCCHAGRFLRRSWKLWTAGSTATPPSILTGLGQPCLSNPDRRSNSSSAGSGGAPCAMQQRQDLILGAPRCRRQGGLPLQGTGVLHLQGPPKWTGVRLASKLRGDANSSTAATAAAAAFCSCWEVMVGSAAGRAHAQHELQRWQCLLACGVRGFVQSPLSRTTVKGTPAGVGNGAACFAL